MRSSVGASAAGTPNQIRWHAASEAGTTSQPGRIIIAEAGRRTREGQSQDQIADQLRPAMEAVLDELDRWLTLATK